MGLTRFPNGLTACSTTALQYNTNAGDGSLDCLNLYSSGTATLNVVAGTNGSFSGSVTAADQSFLGETVNFYATVGSVGTLSDTYFSAPFNGKFGSIFAVSKTSARVLAITVHAGSDTASASGTLSFTSGAAWVSRSTAVNAGTFTIGSALILSSAVAGSDGTAYIGFTLVRTS